MNQLPVERRSPPVESSLAAATNSIPVAMQTAGPPVPQDAAPKEPERVAIGELKRTTYVPPKYPRTAQRKNASGWVDLGFTVAQDGTVHTIEIIESSPGAIFDDAAIEAVSQWRFEQVIENGDPVEKRAAVRIMFSLE
jgi:protein TonB